MANPYRGEVTLSAADDTFTLSYSVNAICELEEFFDGKPIGEIAESLGDGSSVKMSTIRALVWAGLRDHHPDVDLTAAGVIASKAGIPACMDAIGKAFERTFPPAEAGKAKPRPRNAKAG